MRWNSDKILVIQTRWVLLGKIAAAASDSDRPTIPTHFPLALSVCRLSTCMSHSCPVFKPFDGFRCHLAGTLVGSNYTVHCVGWSRGVPDRPGKGEICWSNPQPKHAIANSVCCHLWTETRRCLDWQQRFRFLPNYSGLVTLVLAGTIQFVFVSCCVILHENFV